VLHVSVCVHTMCEHATLRLVCGRLAKCTARVVTCTAQEQALAKHYMHIRGNKPRYFVRMGWRACRILSHIMFHVPRVANLAARATDKHWAWYHLGLDDTCVLCCYVGRCAGTQHLCGDVLWWLHCCLSVSPWSSFALCSDRLQHLFGVCPEPSPVRQLPPHSLRL
jgi:hypothetical protein